MKTALNTTTPEQAKKQVKLFSLLGFIASLLSLFIFWWSAIAGIAFSARALLLTWHKSNIENRMFYRVLAALSLIASAAGLGLYYFYN